MSRRTIPSKVKAGGAKASQAELPSRAAEPPKEEDDPLLATLIDFFGADLGAEYRALFEPEAGGDPWIIYDQGIETVWELFDLTAGQAKEYLALLRERPIPAEPKHYLSPVFVNPILRDFAQREESRKAALLRTDVFKEGPVSCGKCGQNFYSTRVFQDRAGDEPPTTLYKCGKCANVWTVRG